MAITTLDGAIAGMRAPVELIKAVTGTMVAFRPINLHYLAGIPGVATTPSPGIGGEVVTAWPGQLPFSNPGEGNSYLARFQGVAIAQAGVLLLCDRLWHNSGIDITSNAEQTFTESAQIPARDANGSNAGVGVLAAVEVSAATGAGTPTLTLKYTNQDGVPDKIATGILTGVATSAVGSFYQIGLAAGDTGIRKAQSLQLSATWTSGTIHVVLYRILARLELSAGVPSALDVMTGGFPRMYDNTVPFVVFHPVTTTTTNIMAQMIVAQG